MSESVKAILCCPQLLDAHAEQLMRERGWAWPAAPPRYKEAGVDALARLWATDDPEVVEQARRAAGAHTRGLIEDLLLPALVAMLPSDVQRLVGRCVVIKAARTARPQGVARHYRDEGVVVFVNGGLPLLVFDVLGHALALIRDTVAETPDVERIRSVAALLLAFRGTSAELDFAHLPRPEGAGLGARSALGNLVLAAELFILAHELGHALAMLGLIPEEPSLGEFLAPIPLEPSNREGWLEELSADAWALDLLIEAAGEERAGAAAVGCLLALEWSHILDWVFTIPSDVPFPPKPGYWDYRQVFSPPADLRLHVASLLIESWSPDVLQRAAPYRSAMHQLLRGLQDESGGGCIAPNDRTLCAEPRAPHGWLCPRHAVIGR